VRGTKRFLGDAGTLVPEFLSGGQPRKHCEHSSITRQYKKLLMPLSSPSANNIPDALIARAKALTHTSLTLRLDFKLITAKRSRII
jgi:hypothetical protein